MFKSKVFGFFTFFIVFLGIDIYVWQGVKWLTKQVKATTQKYIKWIYWGYSVFILLFMVFGRFYKDSFSPTASMLLGGTVVAILGIKIIWLIFLLLDDIIRLFRWIANYWKKPSKEFEKTESAISRLKFIQYLGLGFGALFFGSAVWGIFKGAHNYIVLKRKLKIKGLPESFKGLKIAQISDVHTGSFWDREAVIRGVNLLNEQGAYIVFFTGDFVNDKTSEADPWIDVFSKIKAPMGVFSTLGNHDYGDYSQWPSKEAKKENLDQLIAYHKQMGWDLLMDEHRIIERNGEKIAILGVQNWSAVGRFPKYGNLEKAYKGTEDIAVKLLLSHDPTHWRAQVLNHKPDIQATFSGHTHGLQMGVDTRFYRWSPAKFIYNEWMDLYTENNQHLYVNRGFGYLGYPGRMGIYPEITLFELV